MECRFTTLKTSYGNDDRFHHGFSLLITGAADTTIGDVLLVYYPDTCKSVSRYTLIRSNLSKQYTVAEEFNLGVDVSDSYGFRADIEHPTSFWYRLFDKMVDDIGMLATLPYCPVYIHADPQFKHNFWNILQLTPDERELLRAHIMCFVYMILSSHPHYIPIIDPDDDASSFGSLIDKHICKIDHIVRLGFGSSIGTIYPTKIDDVGIYSNTSPIKGSTKDAINGSFIIDTYCVIEYSHPNDFIKVIDRRTGDLI